MPKAGSVIFRPQVTVVQAVKRHSIYKNTIVFHHSPKGLTSSGRTLELRLGADRGQMQALRS